MMRKGQGISLNVIIIAAIALIVMVVLIALVLRSGGDVNVTVGSCEGLGENNVAYQCIPENPSGPTCPNDWTSHPTRGCSGSEPGNLIVCCVPFGAAQ